MTTPSKPSSSALRAWASSVSTGSKFRHSQYFMPPSPLPKRLCSRAGRPVNSGIPVHRAEFVPEWVTHVSEVHLDPGMNTNTWGIFASHAAVSDPRCMPRLDLLRGIHGKSDRAAVRERGRLTVDGRGHHEHGAFVGIADVRSLTVSGGATDCGEYGVIELLRLVQIVGSDRHVRELARSPFTAII